jgi:polyisoprenyl-phosphate glycosyltransferase
MHKQQIAISIVCPFFNEENMVDLFMKEITAVVNELDKTFEVVCVNDGSTDNTLAKLLQAKEKCPNMKIINFSEFWKRSGFDCWIRLCKGRDDYSH